MMDEGRNGRVNDVVRDIVGISLHRKLDTLLYAEAGEGWVTGSIFLDDRKVIEVNQSDEVLRNVVAAWKEAPEDRKWVAMTVLAHGRDFHVTYLYDDDWCPQDGPVDRESAIVRSHFGDKEIVSV